MTDHGMPSPPSGSF